MVKTLLRSVPLAFLLLAASLVVKGMPLGCDSLETANQARLFGPGVISTGMNERDAALGPDGQYLFFTSSRKAPALKTTPVNYPRLLRHHTRPKNGNKDIYYISTAFIEQLRQ